MTYIIQLPQNKDINKIPLDNEISINLKMRSGSSIKNQENRTLDIDELYEIEKNETNIYRFYGTINFMSVCVGIEEKNNGYTIQEFFQVYSEETKHPNMELINFKKLFKIYLIKKERKLITGNIYRNEYKVLTNINDYDLIKVNISRNIFNEECFNFVFYKDIESFSEDILLFVTPLIYAENDIFNGQTLFDITQENFNEYKDDITGASFIINDNNPPFGQIGDINLIMNSIYPFKYLDSNNNKINTTFINKIHNHYSLIQLNLIPSDNFFNNLIFNDFKIDLTNLDYNFDNEILDDQC